MTFQPPRRLALLACGVIAAASLLACGKPVTPATANVRPTYDPTTGRLTKLSADANGNGVPDTWGYMDGSVVVRVEVDEDEDGRIDRWEYHHPPVSPDRARPDQTLERIERSTRRDGRVSRWEYFANGVMTRAEEDTTGDGKVDKWETYTGGTLSLMALDTQGTGRPDRRLVYGPDGTFEREETETGSGHFKPLIP